MIGEAAMLPGNVKRAKCGSLALTVFAVLWVTTSTIGQVNADKGIPLDPWQAAASRAYRHGQQTALSADRDGWSVSLTGSWECAEAASNRCYSFGIEAKTDHSARTFHLANETAQVDAITIVNRQRFAILGRTPDLSIVTVVDLSSARQVDRIICSGASLSPDSRYFVYGKFVPAHSGYGWSPSAEYLAYDLDASPEENRTPPNRHRPLEAYDAGWPIYPPGLKNTPGDNMLEGSDVPAHWAVSLFVWRDETDTVALADRWQGAIRLVLADFAEGVPRPTVRTYGIDPGALVDLAGCRGRVASSDSAAWSKDPSTLLRVTKIGPWNSNSLRLTFAPHPCLANTVLDVALNPRAGA